MGFCMNTKVVPLGQQTYDWDEFVRKYTHYSTRWVLCVLPESRREVFEQDMQALWKCYAQRTAQYFMSRLDANIREMMTTPSRQDLSEWEQRLIQPGPLSWTMLAYMCQHALEVWHDAGRINHLYFEPRYFGLLGYPEHMEAQMDLQEWVSQLWVYEPLRMAVQGTWQTVQDAHVNKAVKERTLALMKKSPGNYRRVAEEKLSSTICTSLMMPHIVPEHCLTGSPNEAGQVELLKLWRGLIQGCHYEDVLCSMGLQSLLYAVQQNASGQASLEQGLDLTLQYLGNANRAQGRRLLLEGARWILELIYTDSEDERAQGFRQARHEGNLKAQALNARLQEANKQLSVLLLKQHLPADLAVLKELAQQSVPSSGLPAPRPREIRRR